MVMIQIPDDIAQELKAMAERKNRPIDEIAASYIRDGISSEKIEETESQEDVDPFDAIDGILDYDITDMSTGKSEEGLSALDALMGLFDDDVTDMSTTVKETMREYHKNKKCKS